MSDDGNPFSATLRQIAAWVVESCDPDTPLSRQISLEDIDCDEIEAAAAELDRLTLARAEAEKKGFEKARQQAAEVAMLWICRTCGGWFPPKDNRTCSRPDWERQGTPEEIADAILAMESKP